MSRAPGARDERGVILPMTVILFAAVILLASLVIDVGGDRIVRRDMQSVADLVALDVARALDGRTAGLYTGYSATAASTSLLAAEKAESLGRQGGLLTEPDEISIRLAMLNPNTGEFLHWAANGEVPNGVRAYAVGSSAFRFLPATPESDRLERSALALAGQPLVCISAGASLASITSQPGGPLDVLLGKFIGLNRLSLVSPGGVASLDAKVPLGGLATQLGVGRVEDLATLNITGRSFLQAAATVLSNNGNLAAAQVMNDIAARVNGTTSINLGSILKLDTGKGSAVGLNQEAFGLARAIIEVSNGSNFVDLTVPAGVTGILPITFQAKIIQPTQITCGGVGTRAHSSQIQLKLTGDVTQLVSGVASTKIDPLLLTFGDGWAEVNEITCTPAVTRIRMSGDTAVGLAKLHLDVGILGLLGVTVSTLKIDVPDPDHDSDGYLEIGKTHTNPITFNFNPGGTEIPPTQTVGNSVNNLGLQNASAKVQVLGLPVSGLNPLVNSILGGVDGHLNSILAPELAGLGLRLGTVEIGPTTRPSCSEIVLRD